MERKKRLPKFTSEQEEAAFWEEHTPSEFFRDEDFKPLEVRAPLDRPITIRLETRLRRLLEEYAAAHRLGPSTAARHILKEALARFEKLQTADVALNDFLASVLQQIPVGQQAEMESVLKEAAIGDPENPSLIVLDPRRAEPVFRRFFIYLLAALGADVVRPGHEEYESLKARARSQTG